MHYLSVACFLSWSQFSKPIDHCVQHPSKRTQLVSFIIESFFQLGQHHFLVSQQWWPEEYSNKGRKCWNDSGEVSVKHLPGKPVDMNLISKSGIGRHACWHSLVIPVLGNLRQENPKGLAGQPSLLGKFQASERFPQRKRPSIDMQGGPRPPYVHACTHKHENICKHTPHTHTVMIKCRLQIDKMLWTYWCAQDSSVSSISWLGSCHLLWQADWGISSQLCFNTASVAVRVQEVTDCLLGEDVILGV